jgi:lipopolysaccharide export system permease protein
MKLLTRYFLSEFLKPFFLALFFFEAIILLAEIFNEIRFILDHRTGFLLAAKYFGLQVPGFLVQITPHATLFGVLFSLSRLSRNSELIAMRSGGVDIYRAAIPLALAGAAICLCTFAFNETVVPEANRKANQVKWYEIEKKPQAVAKTRKNLSMVGQEGRVYHLGTVDGMAGEMTDVLILEFGNGIHLKSRLDARRGKYEDGRWVFKEGYLRVFDDTDTEISAKPFASLTVTLPEAPKDFLKEHKDPQERSILDLAAYIRQLKRSGSTHHKELVAFHTKLAVPLGCLILAVLGVPWGWTMGKYSGVVVSFGVCLLVAFLYLGGMQIGQSLGNAGVMSPFVAVWFPNFLFAGLGPVLLVLKDR